jgi:hypothetical protein
MEQVSEILIQYAQAVFSQRIYLFLQFPNLRGVFEEMERKKYYFSYYQLNSIATGGVLCSHCPSAGSAR